MQLAETLAAYERGEINVLINAMLLAEGWNSPRATVVMHLAPTASNRVYQQRIGRIMRIHPRKEAGIVVDFVPKGATHNERVVSLHSLLDADFYREGARVTPAPRRRMQRRARRKLTPAPWLVPVTPDVKRRLAVIQREWQRVDPRFLDEDEQRYWATIAGRNVRFEERDEFVQKFTEGKREQGRARAVPVHLRRREPEPPPADDGARRPRLDDASTAPSFDDLVTLVTQAPTWDKDRLPGRPHAAAGDRRRASPTRPSRSSPAGRGGSRARPARCRTGARAASTPRRSACSARSPTRAATGTRRTRPSSSTPRSSCRCRSGAALLASAEGYTPRATKLIDAAREGLGTIQEVAAALADNLPAPKAAAPLAPAAAQAQEEGRAPRGAGPSSSSSSGRTAPRPERETRRPPRRNAERRRTTTGVRMDARFVLLIPLAFVAGLITAISPCVFPVLPICSRAAAGGSRRGRTRSSPASRLLPSFTLFATWLLDALGLPEDLLRNLSIGLLFLLAATLLFPQVGVWSSGRSRGSAGAGRAATSAAASCSARASGSSSSPARGPVLARSRRIAARHTSASRRSADHGRLPARRRDADARGRRSAGSA